MKYETLVRDNKMIFQAKEPEIKNKNGRTTQIMRVHVDFADLIEELTDKTGVPGTVLTKEFAAYLRPNILVENVSERKSYCNANNKIVVAEAITVPQEE